MVNWSASRIGQTSRLNGRQSDRLSGIGQTNPDHQSTLGGRPTAYQAGKQAQPSPSRVYISLRDIITLSQPARPRTRTPTREGTRTDPKMAGRSGRFRNAVLRPKGSPYIAQTPFRAVRGLLGHFRGILEPGPIPSLQRQPETGGGTTTHPAWNPLPGKIQSETP